MPGGNAHLHSYFQSQGGWSSFHTNFITAPARDLTTYLPDGYVVDIEQSLQIREIHPDTGERIRRPEPDLTIYRTSEAAPSFSTADAVATRTQPIPETLDLTEDLYYNAIVIYQAEPDAILGRAVTRIELLSPTNKQGDGHIQYREKRYAALKSEVARLELDFLHETPPVVKGLPIYPSDPGSDAYHITVSDPSPSFDAGFARTDAFGVDILIPDVTIPLGDGHALDVDFNRVDHDVYLSLSAYSRRVDYETLPLRFERYSPADQERIRQVMAAVQEKLRGGVHLDI